MRCSHYALAILILQSHVCFCGFLVWLCSRWWLEKTQVTRARYILRVGCIMLQLYSFVTGQLEEHVQWNNTLQYVTVALWFGVTLQLSASGRVTQTWTCGVMTTVLLSRQTARKNCASVKCQTTNRGQQTGEGSGGRIERDGKGIEKTLYSG